MNRTLKLILISGLAALGAACTRGTKPRVAIVGIGIECSTFSPARTTLDMFRPIYGDDILKSYPFFREDTALLNRAEWRPAMLAWATPGGMVTRECYDTLVDRSLRALKEQLPVDGLFFDIHGAMSVEGLDDPEGDYITKVREMVGDNVLISTSMDPHGCVSHRLAESPAVLVSPDGGMTSSMEKFLRVMQKDDSLPVKVLEVNRDHPLLRSLLRMYKADAADRTLSEMVECLFDACLLQDGYLKDPQALAARSNALLEQAAAWYGEVRHLA